ncbi:MAG TPA: hypothetical protein PKW98_07550 [Candidatus Wallbacteria bacterium]|nr:MAG: hypothetical protein BWY32_01235 [bacterium ADurb.Bin243]HPG57657.1 hypothetical protein [Candidatus Wallbacteria bacterium]
MFSITSKRLSVQILSVVLLVTFSFTSLFLGEAQANVKHLLVGGLVGAGAVIAWPTISAALGCAAGAVGSVAAGIGSAVVGGVAAAGAAVATGGAAVGGAIAGVGVAAGSAVTAGFGAIGGAVAAITASPLFVPALLIAGAVIIGYIIYKKKFAGTKLSKNINPFATGVTSTSAPTVAANTGTVAPTAPNPSIPTSINPNMGSGAQVASGSAPTNNSTPTSLSLNEGASAERKPNVGAVAENVTAAPESTGNNTVAAAHEKYVNAYKNYINLLSGGKASDAPEVQKALGEYKAAFDEYQKLTKAAAGQTN